MLSLVQCQQKLLGKIKTRVGSCTEAAICYSFQCQLSKERWQNICERLEIFKLLCIRYYICKLPMGGQDNIVLLGFGSRFKPLLAIVEGQATVGEW